MATAFKIQNIVKRYPPSSPEAYEAYESWGHWTTEASMAIFYPHPISRVFNGIGIFFVSLRPENNQRFHHRIEISKKNALAVVLLLKKLVIWPNMFS